MYINVMINVESLWVKFPYNQYTHCNTVLVATSNTLQVLSPDAVSICLLSGLKDNYKGNKHTTKTCASHVPQLLVKQRLLCNPLTEITGMLAYHRGRKQENWACRPQKAGCAMSISNGNTY